MMALRSSTTKVSRWILVHLVALASATPAACASEGDSAAVDSRDASGDSPGDVSYVDPDGGDGAVSDAGPCSSSKLCVVAVPMEAHNNLAAVWGSSATDVWAVGSSATIVHYDGV